ncbi:hypothetical protein J22TS1_34380 [Siminovitchia terrae]|uniref:NEAT domain-containing protein n=1 Tax=Siminovitchia terrae TaxID=1914933 RepID=UPI001B1DC600|nr:NEAT domain-containing protein [Siminovitchia terrae]GIN92387.1 hypothetical protein J22TS1_34380 [Siminovitchia terrae]
MKRILSIMLIFALTFLSIFPSVPSVFAEAKEDDVYADGEYNLPFQVWKDNADSPSVADGYFEKPAKLTVENGEYTVQATLKNSSWWQYFKVQLGNDFVDVTTVSDENDTRVVQFKVDDLNQILNAKVHIIVTGIPGLNYDNKYDIRFKFDPSGIPLASQPGDNENGEEGENPNNGQTPEEGSGSEGGQQENGGDEQDPGNENGSAEENGEDEQDPGNENGSTEENGGDEQDPGNENGSAEENGGDEQDPGNEDGSAEENGGDEQDPGKEDGTTEENEDGEKTDLGTIILEEGNYTIALNALHAKEDKPSGMARYIDQTGSLAVKGGKTLLTLTLTDHKTVTGFQVEGKQPVKEEVNEADNTRAVTYEFDQLTTMMNAQVQYSVGAHNGDQPLRLQFNKDSITEADEKEEDGDTNHPKYADGVYALPFVVWKELVDEQSVADDYFEKPAKLTIENGKYTVQAELKNSSWWQYFKVQSGNDFIDVTEVSKDEEKDTKIVEFKVDDLDQILNAKVHIIVPFINYDNQYDIRFKFDPSEMELQNGDNKPEPIHLEDGNYTIDLEALHAKEDKPSGMARYIDQTASLAIKGGKTLLTLTLTDHKTVTGFQVEGKQPVKEEVDEVKNMRAVTYELDELTTMMNAQVQYTAGAHNGDQPLRLAFNEDSVSEVVVEEPEETSTPIHLDEGNYTIALNALHAKEDKPSGMARYIDQTASLAVKGGKTLLTLTLTDHKTVTGFQVEGKQPVKEEVNEAKNTRTVTYELDELTTMMNAQVQYTVGAHNGDQPLRLQFDKDSVTVVEDDGKNEGVDQPKYKDGVYKLPFVVWQAEKDEKSVADDYFEKPAQLTIEDGNYTVQAELKNSSWWQYFKVQSGNDFVDATTVSEDVKKGTRIVKFKVDDLDQILNAKVHIIVTGIPGLNYDNKYDIRFKFDTSEIPISGENPGEGPGENPGEGPGETPGEGSGETPGEGPGENPGEGPGETPGEGPGETPGEGPGKNPGEDDSKYKDGVYTLPFVVWKDKENISSVADGYFVKPATVKIEKGKYTVQTTLKNGSWWKSFQTAFGNKYKEVKTVSENKKDDTRIVQFAVEDLDEILNGKVHIIVKGIPGFEYDNKYDIRFKFHTDQLKLVQNGDNGFVDDGKDPIGEDNNDDHSNNENQNGNNNSNNNGQNGNKGNGEQNQAIDPRNLKDGEYSIEYKVLKYNTNQTSVMNDYVVSPGHLKVKDGKKFLAITLKNSSWITDFKVNQQGKLAAPAVLSTDTKADTRVVEFEVGDLFKKLDAWVKVDFDIPGLSYHNEYDVQFAFDPNSIKLLKAGENYPPKGEVEDTKQKSNGETKSGQENEQDTTVPAFDRNGDKINKSNNGITNKLGINPKTADKAKIILFATLLMGSLILLIIKWRRKLGTNN